MATLTLIWRDRLNEKGKYLYDKLAIASKYGTNNKIHLKGPEFDMLLNAVLKDYKDFCQKEIPFMGKALVRMD